MTFKCDLKDNGSEILNSSQRNNLLVWPSVKEFPNSQYRTSWKNMCNVTAMVMSLEYSGWVFPSGQFSQPEDNLAYFILTNGDIRAAYKNGQPAMYDLWVKSIEGKVPKSQLSNIFPPTEIHLYLSKGVNLWMNSEATTFSTSINFLKALWKYLVEDNLPMVISTNFGGFGHIVTCVGVNYAEADFVSGEKERSKGILPEIVPQSIIVDDPWGKLDLNTNKYPTGGGGSGNNIIIPWKFVVEHVKPLNSLKQKWAHTFKHGMPVI